MQCTLACDDGFAFAFRPTGDFTCETSGTSGFWIPPPGVTAFPDCSVTSLSSVVSIPTNMRVGVVSERKIKKEKSLCDDTFFLKQVEDHVRQRVLGRLQEVCGDSLYCDVTELEAICGDVLSHRQVWTNEVFRKRRSVLTQKEITTSVMIEGGGKQMIEIVFKLVGETHSNVLFGRALMTYLQANIRTLFQAKLHSSVSLRIWNPYRAKWKNLLQVAVSMWSWEDSWWTLKPFHFCLLFISVILEPFPKESSVVSHIIKDLRLIKNKKIIFPLAVNCPVGTHFNVVTKECQPCTAGSYQPEEAQDTCLVCPGGTFTKVGAGATTEEQCKAQCKPGTYSADGLETCRTCRLGRFQENYAQSSCEDCGQGMTTLFRGATSREDCVPRCGPGTTSDTGLEPCFPCPLGYFQHGRGTDHCFKCPNQTLTLTMAADSIKKCEGLDNPQSFRSFEVLSVNDCFSLPCQNGGSCLAMDIGFQCECDAGWRGSVCDVPHDPCLHNPCLNHGTCLKDGPETYTCVCDEGFTGQDCEIDVDECEHHQCQNNATCIDAHHTDFEVPSTSQHYFCECRDGFRGEYCEENIDDCETAVCEAGGQCVDGIGTFSCICPPGFK